MNIIIEYTPAETAVAQILTDRISVEGLVAKVVRPCGCMTTHHMKPGKGGWKNPSNTKFINIMALTICPPCQDKLAWIKTMPV